jgi:hypothetical protein
MKYLLAVLMVLGFHVPAAAQNCGFPGVAVSASPQAAVPGEEIVVTLTNNTNQNVTVPCGEIFRVVYAGPSCAGDPIYFAPCFTPFFVTLLPGQSLTQSWDQMNQLGQQVPEGTYSLRVQYVGGSITLECCVPVTICSVSTSPVSYCTSGTSAAGCRAQLLGFGSPSVSAGEGFVVQAIFVEWDKRGMLFYGQSGRQATSWGNGTSYQCVSPPVKRGGILENTQPIPGQCLGIFNQDLNARWCPTCPQPNHAPTPGQKMQIQFWYRDPLSTSNQTTGLSDALEADVCP